MGRYEVERMEIRLFNRRDLTYIALEEKQRRPLTSLGRSLSERLRILRYNYGREGMYNDEGFLQRWKLKAA